MESSEGRTMSRLTLILIAAADLAAFVRFGGVMVVPCLLGFMVHSCQHLTEFE